MSNTIFSLSIKHIAKITKVAATPTAYAQRLLALGLIPGAVFRINRKAPFGDPIEIELIDSKSIITLRKHEAAILQVVRIDH